MGVQIFGEWAQGASHERINKVCQDSWDKIDYVPGIWVATVADGHGSDKSPYSDIGSKVATKVFKKLLVEHYQNYDDLSSLETFLAREGDGKFAQIIDREWKRTIIDIHKQSGKNCDMPAEEIYRLYGSTLLGVAVTEEFIFAFQIGDGDITYVDNNVVESVIDADKFLGVETHSLCKNDSWKKAISLVRHKTVTDKTPYMYMLTTDGFANSYISQEEYYKACKGYFDLMCQHGVKAVKSNLRQWLIDTSHGGCGDDITAVFVFAE